MGETGQLWTYGEAEGAFHAVGAVWAMAQRWERQARVTYVVKQWENTLEKCAGSEHKRPKCHPKG